jgi:hypothetical protein
MEVSDHPHTPVSIHPREDSSTKYPMNRWLGGPQSQSGHFGEEKNHARI